MARVYKVVLVGLLIFLLGGCANSSWVAAGKIIPPVNNACPLEGKWTVLQDLHPGENKGKSAWVGETAQFTGDVALLGNYIWNNPNYKIKKVNTTDYLISKYFNLSSTLVPDSQEVYVITVSAAENFLGEFMKIDDASAIAFFQNNVLYLRKVSDQVDSSLVPVNPNELQTNVQSKPGVSGVMVGLRVPAGSNANGGANNNFTYRTLWIASDNKKLHQVLTGNDIFFPRNSGFWQLQVRRVQEGAKTEDLLSAHDVSSKVQNKMRIMTINQGPNDQETVTRIIDYVGNDYVAVENDVDSKWVNSDQGWSEKRLQVLPVDKISAPEGIKFSDLLGSSGLKALTGARTEARQALSNEGITAFDENDFEQNFGLIRKNGHWYLRGRINYQEGDKPDYMDFNVNLIPPAKLIFYDMLCLSWQNIKDRVPDAVDAYTSPNRDIALIITKTKLYIYTISYGQLVNEPLAKIGLKDGESVIMAEWATGSYVDNWEKALLAFGAKAMTMEK